MTTEDLQQLFIEHAPAALAMFDRDMRYLAVSRRWMVDYRLGNGEIIGRTYYEVFPQAPERWKAVHRRGLAGDVMRADEERLVRHDGSQQWLCWEVRPWYTAEGVIGGVVIFSEDITERKITADELKQNRETLRAVVETVPDAVITIDGEGKVLSFNPAAERMFGYAADEILERDISLLMPSPYREKHRGYLRRYHETGEQRIIGTTRELEACDRSGRRFPVELSVSRVDHLDFFTGVIRDISERRALQREVLRISNDERRRIGQTLHDGLQQEITALSLLARSLGNELEQLAMPQAQNAARLSTGLKDVNVSLRRLSHGLVPVPVGGEGLMTALERLVHRTQEQYQITCEFSCPSAINFEDDTLAEQLYYIAQEAVFNAVKHADAALIRVRLDHEEFGVRLRIIDDGSGIDTNHAAIEGLGLRIMNYRASLIDGSLSINTKQGLGTEVTCIVTE